MTSRLKTLVLGGYGNFGAIIAARLAGVDGVDVVIAGRSLSRAEAYAARMGARAAAINIRDPALAARFQELGADLVICAAGPFQGQDYRVARAAIAAGAHYIDIADARGFVCGISTLDTEAKTNDVLAVSGASSVPALGAAVVDCFRARFAELHAIRHGISGSEKTPGLATVAAVLECCGKPIRQWRDRTWRTVYGWQEITQYPFSLPLGRRWVANCDVPDLEIFPSRYKTVHSVRFQAGLGLRATQFGTWALSWAARVGLLRNAATLAPVLRRLAVDMEAFGNGCSGMFVEMTGAGHDGTEKTCTWEIIATEQSRSEHSVPGRCRPDQKARGRAFALKGCDALRWLGFAR